MHEHFRRTRCSLRESGTVVAVTAIFIAVVSSGCSSPPRADLDAARQAGEATGLTDPITFLEAGPEGRPLDEHNAAEDHLALAEAVERAVRCAPGLQMALARVRIALAEAEQARLLPNPVLNVVVRWGAGKPQIEASLAQDLVTALQVPRRASAADSRLRQAAADAVTVAIDIACEVQERYASAQASVALVPILRERAGLLQRLRDVASSRLEMGEGTRSDLATLDAQRVELEVELADAMFAEREERLRLARLIGEPSYAALWTLDAWTAPGMDLPIESRWVEAALQHRPEVQAVSWKLRALGDEEALAGLLPWEGTAVGIDAQRDDGWTSGPSLSMPLPLFDTGQARRSQITAEQLEARHALTLARRAVVEEVRVAYHAVAASVVNLARIREELMPLQEQRRALAEGAYRAGQSDITSLILAEHDLQLTHAKAIEIERQAATAYVRLRRAVGGPGIAAALKDDSTLDAPSGAAGAKQSGVEPPRITRPEASSR